MWVVLLVLMALGVRTVSVDTIQLLGVPVPSKLCSVYGSSIIIQKCQGAKS